MATTDYQPYYVGHTFGYWRLPLTVGTSPENLTGVDITKFTLYFKAPSGAETAGTGTFTLLSAYPGIVLYKPSVADVSTTFTGTLVIKALYPPSGTTADQAVFDPIPWVITAS